MSLNYATYTVCLLFTLSVFKANAASNLPTDKPKTIDMIIGQVKHHCGACHKVPPADVMPKKFWPRAVQAMADLATKRMKHEFISPDIVRDITAYYYGSSPERLPRLPYHQNPDHSPTFQTSSLGTQSTTPLVINVKSVDLDGDHHSQFLICDGERNEVLLLSQKDDNWQETVLAKVQVPSHTEVVDYDGDGDKDIIVAALGHFPPSDRLAGQVLILRQSSNGKFIKEILLEGVGRITDARPVDIDGDGDLDLAVAVFGGGEVGELVWLENTGKGQHIKHDLLKISGALNVSPVDLDQDGKIDLISSIAQEHEVIVALLNKGAGKFKQVLLAQAPHPMFGFTGMKLVDLDGDSDVDILFTNGDAHDLQMDPKPYHGVQWLENKGELKFQFRDIGRFYGAATAVAGDLDGDGDLDVVASSWNNYWQDPQRNSLIWFENDGKQNFTRHNIISRPQSIVSLELMDISGDAHLDIVAGVFRMDLLVEKIRAGNDNNKRTENPPPAVLNSRVVLLENKAIRQSSQGN